MDNLDLRDNISPKEEPVFPNWVKKMLKSKAFWITVGIVIAIALID